ncbi:MAG: hypothetical protein GXP49_03625 [Deltaproteobacteria bacterium]|nr:hypothetical protein [Deltaproteobacteria bacterium]
MSTKPKNEICKPDAINRTQGEHPVETKWYPGKDGRPRFEIKCECGTTRFKATIPHMKQPQVEDYMGLDLLTFQDDTKRYELRKALPRQLEHIAIQRHAERFPDCPAISELLANNMGTRAAKAFNIGPTPK